ncbi:MAG: TolC family protein [Gammaproteobacteria bacterium]|nr:MAG: TolC family protein [Gammaproteobacteria bacterium]
MFKQCLYSVAAGACVVLASVAVAESPTVADPELSGWIKEVLLQNPEMQAAEAAVDAASGRYRAADRPLFNPELEFDYENSDVDTTTGGLSQAIDWADKRGARAAVADYERIAATSELRSTRQRLAADLLQALADWNAAEAISRVSDEQTTLMTRFARLAERRRQAGDLSQVELDLAHLAAAEAAFEQASASQNLIMARRTLAVLTGHDATGMPALSMQPPVIEPQQLDTDRLLNELPLMQVALAQVSAARAGVELTVREKKPDPTFGFRIGKEDSDTLTGLTFSVPLFVRNTFSAEVDVANASLIQTEREAANIRRQASADLVAAAEVYQNSRQAWNNWEASGAPRLSQRTDLLERLWRAGELNTTDYLVQLKQALDTEVSAIEQHGRMWQAWAAWLAASGQADQWLNLTPAGEKQ